MTKSGAGPFALQCFIYTYNRGTTIKNGTKTPLELCFGNKPDVSHLKPFGTTAYVLINKSHRDKNKSKIAERRVKCTFIGYHHDKKGYIFLTNENKIIESVFEDAVFTTPDTIITTTDHITETETNIETITRVPTITDNDTDNETDYQSLPDQTIDYISNPEISNDQEDEASDEQSENPISIPSTYIPIPGTRLYKHKTKGKVEDEHLH